MSTAQLHISGCFQPTVSTNSEVRRTTGANHFYLDKDGSPIVHRQNRTVANIAPSCVRVDFGGARLPMVNTTTSDLTSRGGVTVQFPHASLIHFPSDRYFRESQCHSKRGGD